MTAYDNTNSGAMFLNEKKTKTSQPDRKGDCEVKCPECEKVSPFWLSGWLNKSRKGQTYLSIKFEAKDQEFTPTVTDIDEDIPF